ncbi:MAG: SPOR domain-containing protein, partial [Calditerrivibrio sp.]|nr:SPOR domain-containing protein [Calditerrivibrio sp.]
LTKQYFSLKDQLSEKSAVEKSHIQQSDNGQQINLQSGEVKVESIKKDIKQAMGENLSAEDNSVNKVESNNKKNEKSEIILDADKEKQLKHTDEPKKAENKAEPKAKIEDKVKNEQKDVKVAKKDDNNDKNEIKKQSDSVKKETDKIEPKKADNKVETKTKIDDKIKKDNKIVKNENEKKVDNKVTNNTPPKEDKSSSKETSSGGFALQLMAFKEQSVAEKEAEKLKSKIKDVYVIKADLGDKGIWYRVRCCNSATESELKVKQDKVKKDTGLNPIPVRR